MTQKKKRKQKNRSMCQANQEQEKLLEIDDKRGRRVNIKTSECQPLRGMNINLLGQELRSQRLGYERGQW